MALSGFCVADSPMRCTGPADAADATKASKRSSDNARCAPRLLPASAWISSMMTVRTVFSIVRPPALFSRM